VHTNESRSRRSGVLAGARRFNGARQALVSLHRVWTPDVFRTRPLASRHRDKSLPPRHQCASWSCSGGLFRTRRHRARPAHRRFRRSADDARLRVRMPRLYACGVPGVPGVPAQGGRPALHWPVRARRASRRDASSAPGLVRTGTGGTGGTPTSDPMGTPAAAVLWDSAHQTPVWFPHPR
jgi:hypothetical protein